MRAGQHPTNLNDKSAAQLLQQRSRATLGQGQTPVGKRAGELSRASLTSHIPLTEETVKLLLEADVHNLPSPTFIYKATHDTGQEILEDDGDEDVLGSILGKSESSARKSRGSHRKGSSRSM